MQITVRLRREAGVHIMMFTVSQIFINNLADKISWFMFLLNNFASHLRPQLLDIPKKFQLFYTVCKENKSGGAKVNSLYKKIAGYISRYFKLTQF